MVELTLTIASIVMIDTVENLNSKKTKMFLMGLKGG